METKDTDIEADSEISIISLPLSLFLSNVVPSLTLLRSRLLKYQLPSHWVIANDAEPLISSCSNYISIAKLECHKWGSGGCMGAGSSAAYMKAGGQLLTVDMWGRRSSC